MNYICYSAVPKAMTLEEVRQQTKQDDTLQEVMKAVRTGRWESPSLQNFKPLYDELVICQDVLLRRTRLVLPASLCERAVDLAHGGHQGVVP